MATAMAIMIVGVIIGGWLARKGNKASSHGGDTDVALTAVIQSAKSALTLSQQNMELASKVLSECHKMIIVQSKAILELAAKIDKLVTEDVLDAKISDILGEDEELEEDEREAQPVGSVIDEDSSTKIQAANLKMFRTIEDLRRMVSENSDKLDPTLKARFEAHLKIK